MKERFVRIITMHEYVLNRSSAIWEYHTMHTGFWVHSHFSITMIQTAGYTYAAVFYRFTRRISELSPFNGSQTLTNRTTSTLSYWLSNSYCTGRWAGYKCICSCFNYRKIFYVYTSETQNSPRSHVTLNPYKLWNNTVTYKLVAVVVVAKVEALPTAALLLLVKLWQTFNMVDRHVFKLYKEHCNSYNLCMICQIFKIIPIIQNFLKNGTVLHVIYHVNYHTYEFHTLRQHVHWEYSNTFLPKYIKVHTAQSTQSDSKHFLSTYDIISTV